MNEMETTMDEIQYIVVKLLKIQSLWNYHLPKHGKSKWWNLSVKVPEEGGGETDHTPEYIRRTSGDQADLNKRGDPRRP